MCEKPPIVGGLLSFHQIGVLCVGAAGDRKPTLLPLLPLPGALPPVPSVASAALQRFVTRGRSKLNHRLERTSMGNILHDVLCNVGLRGLGRDVDGGRLRRHFHDFRGGTDFDGEINRRKVADFQNQLLRASRS